MKTMVSFYKPEWTCGRYNLKYKVALMYNLIAGESFFFEDLSALVISSILSLKNNSILDIEKIVTITHLSENEIIEFLEELYSVGLLTKQIPNNEIISCLRKQAAARNIESTHRKNPGQVMMNEELSDDDAEQAYNKAIKDGGICCAVMELTYECSAKCIHCYNPGAIRNDKEINKRIIVDPLSLNEYKSLIDELYVLGCYKVILTGGDPFSNPLIWEIMDYLTFKGMAFDINTNGVYLETHLDRLLHYYPRSVSISLYSAIPEKHEEITRIKGSFYKTLSTIAKISQNGIPLIIKCCIMRSNVKSYYTVENVAKQYGVKIEFEVSLIDSLDGDHCVSNFLLLTPEMLEIVLRDKRVNLYVGKEKNNFGAIKRNLEDRTCRAGDSGLCFSPNGNMRLCVAHPHILNNIRNQTITDMIKTNLYLQEWKRTKLRDFESCGKYDYCNFCMICAGNNYSSTGNALKACRNNCYIAKCRFELAKKIEKGDDPLKGKTIEECLSMFNDSVPTLKKIIN